MSNYNIKKELYSLLKEIINDIPNDKLPLNIKNIENLNNCDSEILITYIKESIPLLINHKILEAKIQNNNTNDFSKELEEENSNLKNNYRQLEEQLKKLESDNSYYLQLLFRYEITKKILDMKINAYILLQEEYEELKEKLKYEDGKFLDNERKENEIHILRAENSTLKKEISKLEKNIKNNYKNINEQQQTIKEMKNNIDKLNNIINKLQKDLEKNKNYNSNKILNKARNNSMGEFSLKNKKIDKYITKVKIHKNNIFDIQNIKSIYPHTFIIRRKINFNPLKNETTRFENNKNSSNVNLSINLTNNQLLSTVYNKLDRNNKKKGKSPFSKLIESKEPKYKSFSINREGIKAKDFMYIKSINKKRIFQNILYSKKQSLSPKSC